MIDDNRTNRDSIAATAVLRILEGPEPWMDDALCADADKPLDMFFPPPSEFPVDALVLCSHCPVRRECLDYAKREDISHGVFGGQTGRQRLKGQDPATVVIPVQVVVARSNKHRPTGKHTKKRGRR